MKRMTALFAILIMLVAFNVANAQTVCMNTNDQAITFDLSNTDWFSNSEADETWVGVSIYNLDTVGTFGSFMRANVLFDQSTNDMFEPESKYGFTYGSTLRIGQGLYGYGGLGFVSDFGHKSPLLGTASYGVLYSGEKVIIGFGDNTTAGATVSLGGRF